MATYAYAIKARLKRGLLAGAARRVARALGGELRSYRPDDLHNRMQDVFIALTRLRGMAAENPADDTIRFLEFCRQNYARSKSQIFQDLFVQYELGEKRDGFFVEFGATDGIYLSNTHLLENGYGWTGVLAEPGEAWQVDLKTNRKCGIDTRCVWDRSGEELVFNETPDAELSTVGILSAKDVHASARRSGLQYAVHTVSLNDLLAEHRAPRRIDYLSIDTEGSELRILSAFDFSKYDIGVITVEHNHTADREKIHALLTANGYLRKFEHLSVWDDWYVRK